MATELELYPDLQQGTDMWLHLRESCDVTSSEFGAALGLCAYTSRAALVKRKIGELPPVQENMYMRFGSENEPIVAQAYSKMLGGVPLTSFGMVVWTKDGLRLGASPDRVIDDDTLVEIKCKWSPSDSLPYSHLAQMLGQAVFMKARTVHYVKWTRGDFDETGALKLSVCKVTFDDRLWENYVLPGLRYFKTLVKRKMTPMVTPKQRKQMQAAFDKYTTVTVYLDLPHWDVAQYSVDFDTPPLFRVPGGGQRLTRASDGDGVRRSVLPRDGETTTGRRDRGRPKRYATRVANAR